jgi:MFS family permease
VEEEPGARVDAEPVPRAAWRLLGDRNFGPYFVGNLLSNCGTWFQNIAQAILVYRLTHSTFLVGVVNFAQFAGVFVLAPWAGRAADRFDRRRLLVVTQVGSLTVALTLAALAKAHVATAPVVILLAGALGLTLAFAIPALLALVPLLVEPRDIAPAVAVNSVTFNLARAIGPVLAAVVIRTLGIPWAFALNAVSFLALIVALAVIRPRPQHHVVGAPPRLRDSIALLRRDARLLALFVAVAAVSLTVDPVTTLTPGFSTEVFHRADTLTGWFVGAFGLGAVLAVLLIPKGDVRLRTMAATLALLAAGMAGFGLAGSVDLALVALFVAGIGYLTTVAGATTVIQVEVDDEHRGRVMALWSIAFLGLRPLGSLLDGAVGHGVGLRPAVLVMAAPAAVVAVALALVGNGRRAAVGAPPQAG